MRNKGFFLKLAVALSLATASQAQPLVNLGLVGVGRVPADTLDSLGMDMLGGMFSSVWLDPATIANSGGTYSATLYALPDRGFGNGTTAYHPRLQRLSFSITPHYGAGPVPQNQIVFTNTGTLLFAENGNLFTGFDPDDTNFVAYPRTLPDGLGLGLRSLDPEGVTRAADGSWYIADEYGPFIHHFSPLGELLNVLTPPDAYLPRMGTDYPRVINYNAASAIATNDSGRYNNRGHEGVTLTPSGRKLVSVLQSPLVQDGQNRNPSRNTRLLVYDVDPASATYNTAVGEYVHVLPLSAAEANNRHTPVSEILAVSETQFLILQRDGRGLGGDPGSFLYKRIVMVDVANASNLIGTGYDLEKGAPGQLSLPRAGLPTNVVAATSRDLVDMLNLSQLSKYGLNLANTNQDSNTISEKWEGMAILPLSDPAAPNDYLLLVGNDNDFKAGVVYHNGLAIGTNAIIVDNILLAFRIGEDHIAPTLTCPASITVAASTNCGLPSIASRVTAADNSAAPIAITQSPAVNSAVTLGVPVAVTVTATDAAGNRAPSCTVMVTVTDQTAPRFISCPTNLSVNAAAGLCSSVVNFAVLATENCSTATLVCAPPSGSVFSVGTTNVNCTAADDAGNSSQCSFPVTVRDTTPPVIACPADITVAFSGPTGAVVTWILEASDDCSGVTQRVCLPMRGSVFPIGSTAVHCAAVDGAGNTNSCSFQVTVLGARGLKESCLADLIALRATVIDRQDGKELDEAIEHLAKSLAAKYWVDQTHLEREDGKKVFKEEEKAVEELMELLEDRHSTVPSVIIQWLLDRIVKADRLLAVVAIDDATAAGANLKKLAEAKKQLEKGDEDVVEGDFDKAIDHFRDAWKRAALPMITPVASLSN